METIRRTSRAIRKGRYWPTRSSQYAFIASAALLVIALLGYAVRPDVYTQGGPMPAVAAAPQELNPAGAKPVLGPLATALQGEVNQALQAKEWPALDPPMDSLVGKAVVSQVVGACHKNEVIPPTDLCFWGSNDAPLRIVVVGDSTALGYAGPLRDIALNSNGRISVYNMAMAACSFADDLIDRGAAMLSNCDARKQYAVDYINRTKPSVVVMANLYQRTKVVGSPSYLNSTEWYRTTKRQVDKFRANAGKLVLIASPAGNADVEECTSRRTSTPGDCVGSVDESWNLFAKAEKNLADVEKGLWLDSRPWFCNADRLCPSFVGTTPAKRDEAHMTPPYGIKITPVIAEALQMAGVT